MDDVTELYCLIDDFCKEFEPMLMARQLEAGKRTRRRAASLSLAELMTLVVLFHQIRYRQFKAFYLNHVCLHMRKEFPKLPSLFGTTYPSLLSRAEVNLLSQEEPSKKSIRRREMRAMASTSYRESLLFGATTVPVLSVSLVPLGGSPGHSD